jgi:hypothetical protein
MVFVKLFWGFYKKWGYRGFPKTSALGEAALNLSRRILL